MGLSCFGEGTGTSAGHLCDLFEYRTLSRGSGQRPSRWLHARDYQHADVFHQRPPLGGGSTLCRVSSCDRQSSQTTIPFLAHIIHERFCCNRAFAATTSLGAVGTASRQAGSPLSRSTYRFKYAPPSLAAPRACLAWRLRDFATNRHE